MDIESVRHTLEQANLVSIGVGFLLGFVFTFNPVALASIPVSLAYVTKAHEPKKAALFGGMFILGMVIAQALLGLIAGFGGQWVQKIIGLARAFAAEPALVLLDEPSAGLNRQEKEDLARFILRLRFDWKVSMLWIEHDLQMVSDLADRVHVLNLGECIASGTPEEVKRVPAVIDAYVGDEQAGVTKQACVVAR